jgi:hypothetical protein
MVFTRPLAQAATVVAGSAAIGFAVAPIAQDWLDIVGGNWFANAGVFGLAVLATAAFVAGLHALFGTAGGTAGALTMVLVGNPFSGTSSAPEMLPQPVGLIGQLMPPGAGSNLLRSTGYFDGAAAWRHIAVLVGWAAGALRRAARSSSAAASAARASPGCSARTVPRSSTPTARCSTPRCCPRWQRERWSPVTRWCPCG